MEKNDYIARIHRYLSNALDDRERIEFQNDMNQNEALKNDVLLERKLLLGLQKLGDEDLRQTIRGVHGDLEQTGFFEEKGKVIPIHSTTKKIIMKKLIAIAAAAVAIIALAWWGFFRQEPADPNAAFTQYFKPESSKAQEILAGFPSAFAGEMNAQDSLREAMKLYEAGKYDEACTALDSILVRHPANDTAQFYLAMSHLNASRYPKALTLLTSLTALDSSAFQLDSKWYLGLCYLKVDNGLPQAKEIFTALSEDAEYKDRQAARGILLLMAK